MKPAHVLHVVTVAGLVGDVTFRYVLDDSPGPKPTEPKGERRYHYSLDSGATWTLPPKGTRKLSRAERKRERAKKGNRF